MPCSQKPEAGWVPHGSTLQCMSLPICLPILEPKSHLLLWSLLWIGIHSFPPPASSSGQRTLCFSLPQTLLRCSESKVFLKIGCFQPEHSVPLIMYKDSNWWVEVMIQSWQNVAENKLTPNIWWVCGIFITTLMTFLHDPGLLERRKDHGLLKLETSKTSVASREKTRWPSVVGFQFL